MSFAFACSHREDQVILIDEVNDSKYVLPLVHINQGQTGEETFVVEVIQTNTTTQPLKRRWEYKCPLNSPHMNPTLSKEWVDKVLDVTVYHLTIKHKPKSGFSFGLEPSFEMTFRISSPEAMVRATLYAEIGQDNLCVRRDEIKENIKTKEHELVAMIEDASRRQLNLVESIRLEKERLLLVNELIPPAVPVFPMIFTAQTIPLVELLSNSADIPSEGHSAPSRAPQL